jgi:hypothetical protein
VSVLYYAFTNVISLVSQKNELSHLMFWEWQDPHLVI